MEDQPRETERSPRYIGPITKIRFYDEDKAFAERYAAEHTNGNVNEAFRELLKIARTTVEAQHQQEAAA